MPAGTPNGHGAGGRATSAQRRPMSPANIPSGTVFGHDADVNERFCLGANPDATAAA
jgi:hypothetical protein